jgi:hypothetical protein
VLSVQIHEPAAEIPERGTRHERAVDEGPAPALRRNLASNDQFAAIGCLEGRLNRGTFFARPDKISGGTAAHEESHGSYEDGLPRSRLACEDVQARLEFKLEVVDNGEVPDGEEAQHGMKTPSTILSDV